MPDAVHPGRPSDRSSWLAAADAPFPFTTTDARTRLTPDRLMPGRVNRIPAGSDHGPKEPIPGSAGTR